MDELSFLKNLFPRIKSDNSVVIGPGDDCAAVKWRDNKLQLLAVDQVVAEQHFLLETDPKLVGRKLLARNLSDIAAMGGTPLYALCTVAASKEFDTNYHNLVMDGILELADQFDVRIIGGDICGTPSGYTATLTIIGEVDENKVVTRYGISSGDKLFATGCFGNTFSTNHHLTFNPRLAEGIWLAQNSYAKAMLDVSDGILMDGARLATGSDKSLKLNTIKIPSRTEKLSIQNILTDGEDYELLFAVEANKATALIENWPFETNLAEIGSFVDKIDGSTVIDQKEQDLNKLFENFSHF